MPGRLMTALLVALLWAAPAAAQRSTTHGFALGGSLFAASLDPEDGDDDTGGGLSIEVGYGFRSGIVIFLNGAGASMTPGEAEQESYTLGVGDVGCATTSWARRTAGGPSWKPPSAAYTWSSRTC